MQQMQKPSKAEPIQTKHQTLPKSIMLIAKQQSKPQLRHPKPKKSQLILKPRERSQRNLVAKGQPAQNQAKCSQCKNQAMYSYD